MVAYKCTEKREMVGRNKPFQSNCIKQNNDQQYHGSLHGICLWSILGIGSVYILVYNGMLIGGTFGICYAANPSFGNEPLTFVAGHGVIELSCIFMAGGAEMMIGHSIVASGDLKRIDALKKPECKP